eukprot:TRINITY_DN2821_c3_g1_i7.p17 TRINITY_DN2821_c3_g1~~TRINITY_DN2821_c3_g1_i7.p17  ORF type:complete len:112 (-),score=1.71 TRINITY_DN2821_c3_g1_i7:1277-1612(-)
MSSQYFSSYDLCLALNVVLVLQFLNVNRSFLMVGLRTIAWFCSGQGIGGKFCGGGFILLSGVLFIIRKFGHICILIILSKIYTSVILYELYFKVLKGKQALFICCCVQVRV